MENYPANSDRSRQETTPPAATKKRVTAPVIDGTAHVKERTVWDRTREFFGLAECKTFRDYVSALSEMTNRVYGAIDTLLGNRGYQNSNVPGAKVAYSQCFNNPSQANSQPSAQATDFGAPYIIYERYVDAEKVRGKMFELLDVYENVSIDDMFDLAGLTCPYNYPAAKYGWRELPLPATKVVPYGSKYIINLPPVVPIVR